ncbi:alpha/beta hydrolase [Bacillus sp. FJAT-27251]|uniref:alpha/beta fold hydrolase n=1 Tax=Bacillus sp. FJAT-27251 TaxID=1684142 RepID=UPI000A7B2667|nr:alpha/beta hydrolase [Bacillus sp. FJAT-27251]
MKTKLSKSGITYLHFGNGEPLVLLHGLGEVKEGWRNQFELGAEYELIIPDLRGHGEYEAYENISIEGFAADVIGLLAELKIESANICGLSMGGAVAQEMYRQAPHICRSLILVSTFHYFPKKLGPLMLKGREAKVESLSDSRQKEGAAQMALFSWKRENIKRFEPHYSPHSEVFVSSLKACFKVNNLALLPKIQVPTLVIGGQYDTVIPVWMQLWMHKLIPRSEFVIIRNSGHLAKLEAKNAFNAHLRRFLSQQTRTSSHQSSA